MQHAQSNNFVIPKYIVKSCITRKSFTIDTRNQFQPLENVVEKQSNMAQETINNLRNERTNTAE